MANLAPSSIFEADTRLSWLRDRRGVLAKQMKDLSSDSAQFGPNDSLRFQSWLKKKSDAQIELNQVDREVTKLESYLKENNVDHQYVMPQSIEEAQRRIADLLVKRYEIEHKISMLKDDHRKNNSQSSFAYQAYSRELGEARMAHGKNVAENTFLREYIKQENIKASNDNDRKTFTETKKIIREAEEAIDHAVVSLEEKRYDDVAHALYAMLDRVQTFRQETGI